MKVLNNEEIHAHHIHTLYGGIKGAVAGFIISGLMFKFVPARFPRIKLSNLTPSIKTALFISPPTFLTTTCAEIASNNFDHMMYGSFQNEDSREENLNWMRLSFKEKVVEGANNNKYKIILGVWISSLYGSWKLLDRDPLMNRTQKAVQARMYAQGLTVLMLLGSVCLSIYEKKLHPEAKKINSDSRWEKILQRAQKVEQETKVGRHSEDRIKARTL